MTVVDPAFEGAGKKAGIEIWRIENFAPVKYPKNEYGKLYTGDSYIILNTKETNNVLTWDIHFWLGEHTTQDEKGTAAIKAVELDDMLGGLPVQYRETQNHESPAFLSCFKGGIRYVPGGVQSGFKHYNPEDAPNRLFQVKGKRNVRVREVETNVKSMNKGDCYIMDTPKKIYVYVGRYSKRTERLKAIQAANQIRDQDHGGRIKIEVIEPTSTPEVVAEYFTALGGGSRADMAEPPAVDDDDVYEKNFKSTVTLYRVSDASGTVKVDKVAERPLKREMLQSQDCFILDAGSSGIYAWVGKKCTKQEKLSSMKTAEGFIKQNGYPEWTRIQRVVDGGEPSSFKQIFLVWRDSEDSAPVTGKVYALEKIAASTSYVSPKIRDAGQDRETLRKLMKNMGRAVGFCPDDGKGKTELWRIENFELAPVPPERHGLFFGGDSYVLKYTYNVRGREHYIVYFWQGTDSTQDEKAAAALHAVSIDDKLNGRAVQVRVVQGHEPAHFLRVFKGKMVIFLGGHASGFRNVREHDTYDAGKAKLFHVQGTCEEDTRAVEVLPKASNLDSDDCFVLDAPGVTYLWVGKGASNDEKAMAKNVDAIVSPGRDAIVVAEGSEPAEFWKLLGGKTDYVRDTGEADRYGVLSARLFHCSITPPSTKLKVDEIFNFDQEDLNDDDVMVLDTGTDEIFIWLGSGASADERKHSNSMADDYIRSQHERLGGNAVSISIVVKQGEEPDAFKVLFPKWNDNMWQELKSVDNMVAQLNEGIED